MRGICVALLFLVWLIHPAIASIYYVDTSGNDATGDGSAGNPWRTLQFAVSRVSANQGHVIKLSAGTFVEAGLVQVPQGVSIEGAGKDITILKAASSFYYHPGTPSYAADKFLINLYDNNPGNGNQHLKDFTIDGDEKQLHGGIYVRNRSFVTIDGVKVTHTNFNGIWLWDVKDSRITNTDLINCSWGSSAYVVGALNLGNLERVEIDHCYIDEDTGYGIKVIGPSGYNNMFYVKIHDCTVTVNPTGLWNNGSAPNIAIEFYMVYPIGSEIYNCYIDNNISLVHDSNAKPPTGKTAIRVHDNIIDLGTRAKGAGYSIELTMHDAEIDHNYFIKGNYGIANWAFPVQNWNIHHNVFYGLQGGYPGEILRSHEGGLHNVNFYNNTIEFNSNKTTSVVGLYGGASDNVNIKNNLIINNNTTYNYYPNQFIHMEGGASLTGLTVTNNLLFKLPIGTVAGTYSNNLTVDPKITGTGTRSDPYYRPAAGSPLIDAGVNVGFPFENAAPDIGAYEYTGITPPANSPPAVSVTSPANNSSFTSGTAVTITANASDSDGSVTKVEFFNGNVKLGEDLTSPYSFTWNNVQAGNYSITAKATDNNGAATTSAAITISVTNPNTAPAVSISSPANNSSFTSGMAVTITAAASDSDGSVTKVEFFNGNVKLGEDLTSPYSFTWNNVQASNYSISAKATDNNGAATTSAAITISVTNPNTAPAVSISSPANNSSFTSGTAVTITATASDSDGSVTKVEFFNGNVKLGEDLTSPYSFTWNNVQAGNYSITAKATDNNGAATTSAAITISVTNPNTAPAVSISSPANNSSFTSGTAVTITATASDSDGSVTKVEFFNGNVKLGEDLTSPYNFTWNNVQAGNYSISAKATDNNGAATTSAAITISVTNPNTAPAVSISSPANNSSFTSGMAVTITAAASDSDGSVTKVEFFNDNVKLGEDLTSPYSFTWNNVQASNYSISAKATDNNGAATTSAAITISVTNPNTAPAVSISSPANNSSFTSGTAVTITATASDSDGSVAKVEFFNGNVKLGEDLTSPYSFTWNNVQAGNYSITAKATDNNGATKTSAVITISVTNPNTAPAVSISSPANNSSFTSGTAVTITATASDSDGSVTKVEFFNGNVKLGEDLTSPYSFAWNNVQAGNYSIEATATDNSGLTATARIEISVTVPNSKPIANAGPDVSITLPVDSITLHGSGEDIDGTIVKYEWTQLSGPSTVISQDQSPAGDLYVSNLIEGAYIFEITVTDNQGLTGNDQVTLSVVAASEPPSCKVPKFFSPNDDGINDVWEWQRTEAWNDASVVVFNRHGKKVFEAERYHNDWDGKLNGKSLEEDAYYYIIKGKAGSINGAVRIVK